VGRLELSKILGVQSVPAAVESLVVPEQRGLLDGKVVGEERPKPHSFREDEVFGDSPDCSDFVGLV